MASAAETHAGAPSGTTRIRVADCTPGSARTRSIRSRLNAVPVASVCRARRQIEGRELDAVRIEARVDRGRVAKRRGRKAPRRRPARC